VVDKQTILEQIYKDSFNDELEKMSGIGEMIGAVKAAKTTIQGNRQNKRVIRQQRRHDRNIGKGNSSARWKGFALPGTGN